MGTCYTVMLMDEFDWQYADSQKAERLMAFEAEFPHVTKTAEWRRFAIYDFDKVYPLAENAPKILRHCDAAFYIKDSSPWLIERIEMGAANKNINAEALER